MDKEHTQAQAPTVGFQCNRAEDEPFQTLGDDHHKICNVGEYQKGEQHFTQAGLYQKEIEQGINTGAEQSNNFGTDGRKSGKQTQNNLNKTDHGHQETGDLGGEAQLLTERVQRQKYKWQEIQKGIQDDFN